ncbi:MAG: AAA family ATPase [Planctomycetota bacterium]|nr:AAA family ATPase [Planctomycetota bacterium]
MNRFSRYAPTLESLEAASLLGLTLDGAPVPDACDERQGAALLDAALVPGGIMLVTGASGSGKSTLLERAARAAGRRGWAVVRPRAPEGRGALSTALAVVRRASGDATWSVERGMRALARAGLGDAACMVRRVRELSTGQRWRLALAEALERAGAERRRVLLVLDEFGASVDEETALAVAAGLRRALARGGRTAAVVASNHATAGVRAALAADVHAELDAAHRPRIVPVSRRGALTGARLRIARGTRADLEKLAALHYRSAAPATVVRVLTARRAGDPEDAAPVGVLAVAMPTLNGAWRELAWPGVFRTGDRQRDAARLNHPRLGVRCIARVIVEPRFRSLGVATRLVRAYLRRPLTARTEALAAMGRASGFFDAAGMTRYELPLARRHRRLRDLFEQFGVDVRRLACPDGARAHVERLVGPALLERELRAWARSSRATAGLMSRGADQAAIFKAACAALAAAPVAFAAGSRARGGS